MAKNKRRSRSTWPCRRENCEDIARLLGARVVVVEEAFLGEPIPRVDAVVLAALDEEAQLLGNGEPFFASSYVEAWAEKNRAGIYRDPEKRTPLQILYYGPNEPVQPSGRSAAWPATGSRGYP